MINNGFSKKFTCFISFNLFVIQTVAKTKHYNTVLLFMIAEDPTAVI